MSTQAAAVGRATRDSDRLSVSRSAPAPAVAPTVPRQPAPAPLVVVDPVQSRLRRGPFVALVVALLASGLLGLLLLNTVLSQDAFTLHDLERQTAVLNDREQALKEEVAVQESPQRLAERAARLGMVAGSNPAFIGPEGVLGVPAPATPAPGTPTEPQAARAAPADTSDADNGADNGDDAQTGGRE